MSGVLKKRFKACRCACGLNDESIEARYTRLSGKFSASSKAEDCRLPSEKDRDRIIYSQSFRRLGEITQVIPRERSHLLHNRLTHSLKVAQLARRMSERLLCGEHGDNNKDAIELANRLGGLDPSVVETAALAHDLGHPPFGHIIEEFLDETIKLEAPDGYEGNAQSFRIVTFLENRDIAANHQTGMDLTCASLNALIKYPWRREPEDGKRANKFGYYAESHPDSEHFDKTRQAFHIFGGGDGRSLEAEIMDWADDIAYAVYDIEDFYRAGLIPLDKIIRECMDLGSKAAEDPDNELHHVLRETSLRWKSQNRTAGEQEGLKEAVAMFAEFLQAIGYASSSILSGTQAQAGQSQFSPEMASLRTTYRATDEQRRALSSLTSNLVEHFSAAIRLNPPAIDDHALPKVQIDSEAKTVVKILKELTWTYVIDNPDLHAVQEGQRQIVRKVFEKLEKAPSKDMKLLPRSVSEMFGRDLRQGQPRRRHVCDIIASMTETQIADLYARFTGISPGSLLRSTYMS